MTIAQDQGLVLKNYSGFYYVQDSDTQIIECRTRGKLKERILSGDRVIFTPLEDNKGILEQVLPRQNEMYRPRVANVSIVLIVIAYDRPLPSLTLLDRLLLLAQYSRLQPIIVLNKSDLPLNQAVKDILDYYPRAKFPLLKVSARYNQGTEELRNAINGEIAVLAGPSGVGKSSILNLLTNRETAPTQEVSNKIGRGRHTTRHVELYPLDNNGWLVDTPGFSVLDLPRMRREELPGLFRDFAAYAEECKFADCLHYKENECGVKNAVEKNEILNSRYENYLSMLAEVMENERCY
ncbi:MAG: Ribosome small subunit biosis RbfA-release protein RsgA [Firmicutes bacterium]|nr:Ribosome small subunit biosis RbfA-release protein RsgA [Bacillota bacterium]